MDNWIVLKTFLHLHQAHLAKSLLESEGIQAIIKDELMNSIIPGCSVGGIKLLVHEDDYEKSLQLLEEIEHDA